MSGRGFQTGELGDCDCHRRIVGRSRSAGIALVSSSQIEVPVDMPTAIDERRCGTVGQCPPTYTVDTFKTRPE